MDSLMIYVYNALGINLLFRDNDGMMMHACKQECLQKQHK